MPEQTDIFRSCFVGHLTKEQAHAKLNNDPRVEIVDLRPAQCCNPSDIEGPLLDATEVIYKIKA